MDGAVLGWVCLGGNIWAGALGGDGLALFWLWLLVHIVGGGCFHVVFHAGDEVAVEGCDVVVVWRYWGGFVFLLAGWALVFGLVTVVVVCPADVIEAGGGCLAFVAGDGDWPVHVYSIGSLPVIFVM